MIKINDYIFPEENILYIRQQTKKTITVLRKRPNEYDLFKDEIEIKATFEDIEWNYEQNKIDDEYIELSNKYQRLLNRSEELEEENERLKAQIDLLNDNKHFLNNKIDKAVNNILKDVSMIKAASKTRVSMTGDEIIQRLEETIKILKKGEE